MGIFLKRFRTWPCSNACSETAVNTSSETSRAELERLHGNKLVAESFLGWEVMTKVIEKYIGILEMVMDDGSLSEAWHTLTNIAAETQEAAVYDSRAKSELELLEIVVSETVTE